jgi:hypothetical protein
MASSPFQAIRGDAVLVGKAPDGDSARFDPDDARRLRSLARFDADAVSEDGNEVILDGGLRRVSELLTVRGRRVRFAPDQLALVFVET